MTTAVMSWGRLTIELDGHAMYADPGQDIVCAGISALVMALAGALEEAEERGRTKADWDEKDNVIRIWADPNMEALNEIKAYFRMCVKGLKLIQGDYPDHIRVTEIQ